MMTLLEMIRRSEGYLAAKGIERPRREAEEVIADALGLKRLDLYLQFDRLFTEEELPSLRQAIQRRSSREPTAYIAGKVTFAGLFFLVNPDVLIPRPETEILVEKMTQTLGRLPLEKKILWDMCSGSGCIGIALKNRFPALSVVLSDLSEKALDVAKQNALLSDVSFKQGDLFYPFSGMKCDFFVCNPPYISETEYATLSPEVLWEPKMALLSGKSGVEFYARIARELKEHLNPGGLAWLELGSGQGPVVKSLFESEGWRCHYEQDWAGHDRFFFVEIL
jgi:release factor glutamine methyltransferase